MILGILIGIIGLSAKGVKGVYAITSPQPGQPVRRKITRTEKVVVATWISLTIITLLIESLQAIGAILGFFLFVYVVWLGVVRPTLK